MKKVFIAMITITLSICSIYSQVVFDDDLFFDTPEDALIYFINEVKAQDLQGALRACGINKVSENYNFHYFTKRIEAITITTHLPEEYELYREINKLDRAAMISKTIGFFIRSMLNPEDSDYSFYQTYLVEDSAEINSFILHWNPDKIANLTILEYDLPAQEIWYTQRNQENLKKQALIYGADDRSELVVLYELNGETYINGFSFLLYDEGWCIEHMVSNLANTEYLGIAQIGNYYDFLDMVD